MITSEKKQVSYTSPKLQTIILPHQENEKTTHRIGERIVEQKEKSEENFQSVKHEEK